MFCQCRAITSNSMAKQIRRIFRNLTNPTHANERGQRLQELMENGDLEELKSFLFKKGRKIHDLEDGLTLAIEREDIKAVQAVLEVACAMNCLYHLTTNIKAFLILAVQCNESIDILEYLLQSGFYPDTRNDLCETALHAAVFAQRLEAVKALVKVGAHCTSKCNRLDSPLSLAVEKDLVDIVRVMLEAQPSSADHRDGDGAPLPCIAVKNGSLPMVSVLCGGGCSPCLLDWQGQSPLIIAIQSDRLDIVEYLCLNHPECINSPDPRNTTPLMIAAELNKYKTVKALIRYGAVVNVHNTAGMTPLMFSWPSFPLVSCLLDAGCDPNLTDNYGTHALWRAVYFHQEDIVPLLAQANTDLTVEASLEFNVPRETALELAFRKGYLDTARLLTLCSHNQKLLHKLLIKFSFDSPFVDKEKGLAFLVHVSQWIYKVPSLKYLCRSSIRDALGHICVSKKTKVLPLPDALIKYVDLSDLVDNFKSFKTRM